MICRILVAYESLLGREDVVQMLRTILRRAILIAIKGAAIYGRSFLRG